MATTTLAGLQTIPLEFIAPNPFNPRKHFEKGPLQELADSIKVHGVRQPVLVRPIGLIPDAKGKMQYQLVVGERRWRASKLAGKADIPAIVDPNLDDRSALEIMVIENLQREDVHPLDEALGYDALMKSAEKGAPPQTVEAIAAKVGKSIGYVYARMKLLALIPAAREAFERDFITAGHAVLIARLQPKDQIAAIDACFAYNVTQFRTAELRKLDPKAAKLEEIADFDVDDIGSDMGPGQHPRLLAEKGLREWIQDNVNLRLKDVPWDLADAKLFPAAGACATCEKRSASNPALFADLAVKGEDTCFDAECYGKKREAFVKITLKDDKKRAAEANVATAFPHGEQGVVPRERIRQISEQTAYTAPKPDQRILKQGQWLPAKKNECPATEEALVVNGENAGVRKLVCCNGACKVHKHHFSQPRTGSSERSEDPAAKEKREFDSRVDELLVDRVCTAAVAKIKGPTTALLSEIIEQHLRDSYGDFERSLRAVGVECKESKECDAKAAAFLKKAKLPQMLQFLWMLVNEDRLSYPAGSEFKALAKRNKIDLAKLRKQLEKELAPPALQTPAKTKAAAKGK